MPNITYFGYSPFVAGVTNPYISDSMTFNNGSSVSAHLRYFDGLGRTAQSQTQQGPNTPLSYDTVSYTYDTDARLYSTSVPCTAGANTSCSTSVTTQTYDALNRPLVTTDGGGGTVGYCYSKIPGCPSLSVQDVLVTAGPATSGELTKRRQFEYDGLGRLLSVCELTSASGSYTCGQATAQTGFWTRYKYDALGRLIGVCQNTTQPMSIDCIATPSAGQQTRTYNYDGLSRLTSETNPESGMTQYIYDSVSDNACVVNNQGDLVEKKYANGDSECYVYDKLHRVLSVGHQGPNSANTPDKIFVYDSANVNGQNMANSVGRLAEGYTTAHGTGTGGTKITDEGFGYDSRGELSDLYESTPHSAGYYHVPLTYWANGLIQTFGPFLTEDQFGYVPDGEGRISALKDYTHNNTMELNSTSYNEAGQPTQLMTSCSGSTCYQITYQYDPSTLRMGQYSAALNGGTISGALTWNPNGTLQKLVITDPFNTADAQTCKYGDPSSLVPGYDDLGRLIKVDCGSAWQQTFSYDTFGNITKSGSVSWLPGYNPSTNQYTLAGTSYDASGNVLNDTFISYTWDSEGKPLTEHYPNGQIWAFTYDAFGHRVELSTSGSYNYSYVTIGRFRLSATGQTAAYSEYPLPGGNIFSVNGGLTGLHMADWMGTIRAFYSYTGGNPGILGAHAPFGEAYGFQNWGGYPTGFAGQGSPGWGEGGDAVASNTTYWFPERQYRSSQGRWLSPDPAGQAAADVSNPQTWNRYAYVANTPLTATDPEGLYIVDCSWEHCNPCYMCGGGGMYGPGGADGAGNGDPLNPAPGNYTGFAPPGGLVDVGLGGAGAGGPYGGGGSIGVMGILPGENSVDFPGANIAQLVQDVLSGNWGRILGIPDANPCEFGACDPSTGPPAFSWQDPATSDPTKLPTCLGVFWDELKKSLNPFSPSLASLGEPAAAVGQRVLYNRAVSYAAGRALMYPMKSSVVRNILTKSRAVGAAGALLTLDLSLFQAVVIEANKAYRGECRGY